MTTTPLDVNGYPDVMGSRMMSDAQLHAVETLKLEVNRLLATHFERHPGMTGEQARLMAMARSQLEIAGVLAVKSISREGE